MSYGSVATVAPPLVTAIAEAFPVNSLCPCHHYEFHQNCGQLPRKVCMSRKLFSALAALLLRGAPCFSQIITTYAGNDALFTAIGQQATAVQFGQPAGVAIDQAGNVYIAAPGQSMVLKVATNGTISVAAGDGLARYSGDGGQAVAASLS